MYFKTHVAVLGLLALTGCSNWGTNGIGTANITDSDLEQVIKNHLASDPAVPANDIKVSADAARNTATLSGTVSTEAVRNRAVELTKAAEPGLVVADKINVTPPELSRSEYTEDMAREARRKAEEFGDKLGKSLDDAWIHTKIVTKLATHRGTPGFKINVDVVNNVVTLRGEVESSTAKMDVQRIATDTDGVKSVRNLLTVKPS
jgi:osmotically-inducible protein OsmY